MTEKRFILTEQFNGLQGVTFVKDDCADVDTYYTVDGTVDLLNEFAEENEQLKSRVEYLELKIDRERTSYQKQHEKWEEEIQKENEQLKSKNRGLQSELQIFKEDATHSNLQINKLADENEQLKKQLSDDFNQSNCITVQKSIVSDLKKENEQLKHKLKSLNDNFNHLKRLFDEIEEPISDELLAEYSRIVVEDLND